MYQLHETHSRGMFQSHTQTRIAHLTFTCAGGQGASVELVCDGSGGKTFSDRVALPAAPTSDSYSYATLHAMWCALKFDLLKL